MILPQVHPVWHDNQKDPGHNHVPMFSSKNAPFSALFNESHFRSTSGVCIATHPIDLSGAVHVHFGMGSRLDTGWFHDDWRTDLHLWTRRLAPQSADARVLQFDCLTRQLMARSGRVCQQWPACPQVVQALQPPHWLQQEISKIVEYIHSLAPQFSSSAPFFTAVHVRGWNCRPPLHSQTRPAHNLTAILRDRYNVQPGTPLYLVSELPSSSLFANALREAYHVVTKLDAIPNVQDLYPFEVRAAIDFGVAVAANVFVGPTTDSILAEVRGTGGSSFSAFVHQYRSGESHGYERTEPDCRIW